MADTSREESRGSPRTSVEGSEHQTSEPSEDEEDLDPQALDPLAVGQISSNRIYSWNPEEVAAFLKAKGFGKYGAQVMKKGLEGRRLLTAEERDMKTLINVKDLKLGRQILIEFRNQRLEELKTSSASIAPAVTSKIEGAKRTGNLTLNEMKISKFPDTVTDILNLNNLSFQGNRLKAIPAEIGMLSKLGSLKLGGNKLQALPQSIGFLVQLQSLLVEDNDLRSIPDTIAKCHQLRVLDVSQNKLKTLPPGLYKCKKIGKLNCYDNNLDLPKEVTSQKAEVVLRMLEGIWNGDKHGEMFLTSMKLKGVPIFLPKMTMITTLSLDSNSIKTLDGLHNLINLEVLSIYKNKVERLPLAFATLTKLRELKTDRNPITSPPQTVLSLSAPVVVKYLGARAQLLGETIRDVFRGFDADGSGSVNRVEMIEGLYQINLQIPMEEMKVLISEYDDDGNGLINYEEFREIILRLLQTDGISTTRSLDLSSLGLGGYEIDVEEPQFISTLDLSHNCLEDLPDLSVLSALHILILDDNQFTEIPDSACISTLDTLSLRSNQISTLTETLFGLDQLHDLRMEDNDMEAIPCNIVRMSSLRVLSLGGNPLRDPIRQIVPEGIDYIMAYLQLFYDARKHQTLDLGSMDFEYVPLETEVETLRELFLARNKFTIAPDVLRLATRLEVLDLSENHIDRIPTKVCNALTKLKELRLSNNSLKEVPFAVGSMISLQIFLLNDNQIEMLPNSMSTLHSLRLLDISNNKLSHLPAGVAGLNALEELRLPRNFLEEVTGEVKNMTSLTTLNLRNNDIKEVADVFEHMNLTWMDISKNPLSNIPYSLGALNTCLTTLQIDKHLHLADPPDSLIARGTKQLLAYMFRQYQALNTKTLDLSSFQIAKVTAPLQNIDYLSGGLRVLDITNNNVQELPRNVGMCAYLEALIARDNRLVNFPTSTKQMRTLTHLDISGNQFTGVPELLTYTPVIEVLDLSRNRIESLYRRVDEVAHAGFSDVLSSSKREKEREKAQYTTGKLKAIIQTKVMDKVGKKMQSDNRSKQVGALFQLFSLRKLSVANNKIRVLPGSVSRFTCLEELNMSHNELMDIPPDIGEIETLTSLDLSANNLIGLPPEMGKLHQVTTLNVSHNGIKAIPTTVYGMTSLQELNFEHNQIVFLPVELESLETSLTKLKADGNLIQDPPMEVLRQGRDATFTYFRRVRNGQKSRSLVLIDMKLEVLDINWYNLTILTDLELSGNKIRELPKSILLLTNLTVLKCAGNNMSRIVETGNLDPLSQLERLALKENHLSEIEPSFGALVNLKELDLGCNRMRTIAQHIERCTGIKKLILQENSLDNIPRNVFRIVELTYFMASHNSIGTLPNAMCYCITMKELDLSYNKLQQLPKEFGNLELLEYINLNHNKLRELPKSIKRFSHLRRLYLNDNELNTLQAEIGKLKKLERLHVRSNSLFSISPDLERLQNLKVIEIDSNSFLSLPSAMQNLGALEEARVNEEQIATMGTEGNDITPTLEIIAKSDDFVNLRKVPRGQMLQGVVAMKSYLERLNQKDQIPTLNLTHMELTFIPQEVFTISSLTVLDIKENKIVEIPQAIMLLQGLSHLDIAVNHLEVVPEVLGSLTELAWLSFARNHIHTLPWSLENLQKLKYVDVHVNHLPSIHPALMGPQRRQSSLAGPRKNSLDFEESIHDLVEPSKPSTPNTSKHQFQSLSAFKSLSQGTREAELSKEGLLLVQGIKDLEISYNELISLPDLSDLKHLTRINASHNMLKDLPEVVCNIPTLEKLELGDNRIRLVPTSVSKLQKLIVLSLKNNNLRTIPAEVGDCTALKVLSLSANDLVAIPDEVTNLHLLKKFTMSANNVVVLPESIGDMSSLTTVDISSNPIKRLPVSLGALYDTISTLELFECLDLVEPSPEIIEGGLTHLMNYMRKIYKGTITRRMNLSNLNMGKVVLDMSNPSILEMVELRLDKNGLMSLPESIGLFVELRSLRFRDNSIARLPLTITSLSNLQELDMSKNRFSNIPKQVINLTQLVRLKCCQNAIPYSIAEGWIEEDVGDWLQNYLRETTGKRIAAMWSSNNKGEVFTAWQNYVFKRKQDEEPE